LEKNFSNYAYGIRPIIEAIESGKEIEKVFIQNGLSGQLMGELLSLCKEREIPYQNVPIHKLNRLTTKNHQGAIASISPVTFSNVENIVPFLFEQGKTPLFLILDRISDVRNFGAICRTAECAGVDAIVIPFKGGAQINADAIKTSAGAIYNIPICRAKDLKKVINYLKLSGLQIVACTEKGDSYYSEIDLTPPTAIIMGSEEDGISPEYLKLSDVKTRIPISGTVKSLNVSVAAAILTYEAIRQR